MTKSLSPEQRTLVLREEMELIRVNTPYGKDYLLHLCDKVGIKQRIQYFNMVEKTVSLKSRQAELALTRGRIPDKTEIRKVIHDHGFIFSNGFEIRHVDRRFFKLYTTVPIVEVRERIYKKVESI